MTRVLLRGLSAAVVLLSLLVGRAPAQSGANPHGPAIGACATCHRPEGWKPVRIAATYRHAERTFPLDGAHATATCTACHTTLEFSKTKATCASCHQDVHRSELGTECARCHTTRSFTDQARLSRLHEENRFPLRGAHVATACEACHTPTSAGQPQFANRPSTCISCHRADYDKAAAPKHSAAGFPTNCLTCHSETAWRGAPFDHQTTQFPLTGAHSASQCASCHADGVYRGKPTTCISCHQPQFDQTTMPAHRAATFSTDCTTCHTTTVWRGATFDHNTTTFPLTGGHQATQCAACHTDGVFKGKATSCVSCHRPNFDQTKTPPHGAAGFSTDCTTCHTTSRWLGSPFNHTTTRFPLTGGHQPLTCASCHADGVYKGKAMTCVSCHRQNFDRTTVPPHVAAGYSTDCASCHNSTAWLGAGFNHNTTRFPLTGGHQAVTCASCHADGVYRGRSMTCVSCHRQSFDQARTPPHASAGFSTECTTCHTTARWQGGTFNHSTTQFPLTGGHLTATCASCHADGVYRGKSQNCVSCHRTNYDATRTPAHAAAGYTTDCTACHTTTQWLGATFNHTTTRFPLTGGHLTATCASCHADGVYRGKPTTCISCHRTNYDATRTPAHAAAGYSTDCTTCHTTTQWLGANFNHSTTRFPLTGGHLTATCASCHADGVYRGKSTACLSCHQADFTRTTTPPHAAAGFATDCTTCHTTTRWQGATFNHGTTRFPLTGGHQAASCASCHADNVYRGKSMTCVSCHRTDYDGTRTPAHAAAGYSTDCTTCHTTTRWQGATFNHSTTRFPLTGGHLTATCASCHADGVYAGKSTTCVSCHRTNYDATRTPAHAAAGYSTDCTTCHTTTQWLGATFNHSTTQFPLTGAHQAVSCASCHADGVYRGKPTTCISCHQTDFSRTTTPPHAAAGFSTTCTTCHTTTRWEGATFNHGTTAFPLTGAHITTSCATCHLNNVYRGLPATCISCHQQDYTSATNPSHSGSAFPTTCATCHTTTRWQGATFDHDGPYFPIYSGNHRGRWASCATCHTAPGNYAVYTCMSSGCHSRTSTDSEHRGRSGYQYVATACYSCHPRGRS
ncbi:MAG: hypothetical protein IPO52_13310 [Gemmatimonadetes bacterium]|nr:hypothetical protein [Gemmatimonadota bacterium]